MSEVKQSAEDKEASMAAFIEEFRNPSRNDGAMLRATAFKPEYNAVERNLKAGRFATTIEKNPTGCHILLLHGGGGELEASMHNDVMMRLADRGFRVTAYDYPLAPEHQYREINEAVYNAYKEIKALYPKDTMVLFGDSCGTTLGINLMMRLRDEGAERPVVGIWPSPAVDWSMTNPLIPEYEKHDPTLRVDILQLCGDRYAPGEDLTKPEISPIYGDLSNLGRMLVFYSSVELLRPDTELFIEKLKAVGGNTVEAHMVEGLYHDYILQVDVPEAQQALDTIAAFLNA